MELDDEEIEIESEEGVELGYIEPFDSSSWNVWTGGKVGGKPFYINPKNLPLMSSMQCKSCLKTLTFLLQLYIPNDDHENSFHRVLYAFICVDFNCLKKGNGVKVIRCQLPRINDFIPSDISPDLDKHYPLESLSSLFWGQQICIVCNGKSIAHCAKCKEVWYCGVTHQSLHWKEGGHKHSCKGGDKVKKESHDVKNVNYLFPEFEIIIEEEPNRKERDNESLASANKLLEEFKKTGKIEEVGAVDDLSAKDIDTVMERKSVVLDPYYKYFTERIAIAPDQVLRMAKWSNNAALWVSKNKQLLDVDIPRCENCKGERRFEFQILPQLLHYLKIEERTSCNLDWGVLNVYTCVNSCDNNMSHYVDEYIFMQEIEL